MHHKGVDPAILNAWLSARSVARNLPMPVPEFGGFRVDTKSDAEVARWVFPKTCSGLEELARFISEPLHLLKLCGGAHQLRAALPRGWVLHTPSYFMRATQMPPERGLADGYKIETKQMGAVIEACIFSETGALAASGYAAEACGAIIYDRIVTEPDHRRKGLGHVLMRTLHEAWHDSSALELLVATEEGRALYSTLGWEIISPYSTASIPMC